jgi:predicted HicB family RNase H-like nuclease
MMEISRHYKPHQQSRKFIVRELQLGAIQQEIQTQGDTSHKHYRGKFMLREIQTKGNRKLSLAKYKS